MTEAVLGGFRAAGDDLARWRLVVPGSGNLSVWTPAGVIITREGAPLHRLQAGDLCQISRTTEPPVATPSLDTPIHRAIYVSASARAIAHAHPPHAIALSFGRTSFDPPDLEGAHLLGRIPVVSPKRSVIDLIAQAIAGARAVIVEGHGVYARGSSLDDAVSLLALLEESARIAWLRHAGQSERGSPPTPGAG